MASKVMFILAALLVAPAAAGSTSSSPMSKVIHLISTLEKKLKQEADASEIEFHKKSSWCEDSGVSLEHAMSLEQSKLDKLIANIEKDIADIEAFEARMAGKAGELSEEEQRMKDAAEQREKDRQAYLAKMKDLQEVVSALKRTVGILERENSAGEESLAQINRAQSLGKVFNIMVESQMIEQKDTEQLSALLQTTGLASVDSEESEEQTSGNLKKKGNRALELLYDLLDNAKQEIDDANTGEINSRHAYEKMKNQCMEAMGFDNEDIRKAKNGKAETEQSQAQDESDKTRYQQLLETDKKAALKLKADCLKAAADYKAETEDRVGEMQAMEQAMAALEKSSGASTLTYGEEPAKEKKESLIQLVNNNFEAVKVVRNLAHQTHSTEMSRLASRIASLLHFSSKGKGVADPFQKVQGMIENMITKLEQEASDEASHKAYCDKENAETQAKHEAKSEQANKLQIKIDSFTAQKVEMKEDLSELQEELKEMSEEQGEMDSMRHEEKTLYETSKKDMDDGLNGVKIALKVLREYYESQSDGGDAGKSIIGLLEVVESDFSKTIAKLTSDENEKALRYNSQTKEAAIIRKGKEVTVSQKERSIASVDNRISEAISNHDGVQSEIGAILEYKQKLDDMCVAKPEAYEVRKERREKEINGLKEALSTLSGGEEDDDAALLQQSTSVRRQRFLRH